MRIPSAFIRLAGIAAALLLPWQTSQARPFAPADDGLSYYAFEMDDRPLAGAPDFAALNAPLDASARVFVRGAHFYRVGADSLPGTADDERIRFFGVNLSFSANFPDAAQARQLARRLRQLGFNAVRLHHLDSLPSDYRDPPLSILGSGPYPTFNPEAVTRLRTLIGALAEEGLYVNLNLRVGYRFRPAVDQLPALDGGLDMPAVNTPIHIYYPPLVERQSQYAQQLIDALGLRGNPALAMVEINNESSLLASWQSASLWPAAVPSAYAPTLQTAWASWLTDRYGGLARACEAWRDCPAEGAQRLPTPADFGHAPTSRTQRLTGRLLKQLGIAGANAETTAPSRERDFLRFLADTDRRYFDHLRAVVRDAAGAEVPVTGTQMAFGGVMNFDSHAEMDYIDDHIYVAHPDYKPAVGKTVPWRIPGLSTSGDELDRLFALSLRRDHARPFVVSEFNQPFPNPRGAEILPLMSVVAALQDWDGLFFFDYSDAAAPPAAPTRFSLSGDWGKLVLAGQSAQLFRTPLLPALTQSYTVPMDAETRASIAMRRDARALENHLQQSSGLRAIDGLHMRLALAPETRGPSAPVEPAIGKHGHPATPDGSVRFEPDAGRILLNAEHAWGFFGAFPPVPLQGPGLALQPAAGAPSHAALLLTALDGQTLSRSRHLLLTVGAQTTGTQPGSVPPRPKLTVPDSERSHWLTLEADPGGPPGAADRATRAPAWLLRTPLRLTLTQPAAQVRVYPLDSNGQRLPALPVAGTANAAGTSFLLQDAPESTRPWYEIVIGNSP